jgi:hypothetical protein
MEQHTLHEAATNAAGQGQSSHSYSAWRTSQQTQPRIFQYTPPNPQQNPQQQQQQQQQQQSQQPQQQLAAQTGTGGAANANIAPNLDKNIIFANNERLTQQYNLQNAGTQQQAPFTALHDDPTGSQGANPTLAQGSNNADNKDDATGPATTTGGRVLAQSKRAAQNRAAQRAFRQRKDRYIKTLEQKANEYELSHSIITDLRKENIYLRDYVVRLQNEVDSLNTELGRAPMFGSPSTQRNQQNQNQANTIPVTLGPNYPLQIDPQTAAVAAAAAANVQSQDNQMGRLAPTDGSHNAISMPAGNEQQMVEQPKPDEAPVQPKKSNRGRKRKNETQAEGQ